MLDEQSLSILESTVLVSIPCGEDISSHCISLHRCNLTPLGLGRHYSSAGLRHPGFSLAATKTAV